MVTDRTLLVVRLKRLNVADRDLVGLRTRNTENVQDNVVGISLRRRDQFKPDVVWGVLEKIIQNNASFVLADRLEVHLDNVRMPAGNGKRAENTKGRSLDVLSAIKKRVALIMLIIALQFDVSSSNKKKRVALIMLIIALMN